ncbi:unnamed protein product [Toxocara canis]|uniref:Cadherin domain-containing protein n=1 Tax=Toxocara canis TaxID=6265 RepID=A0A183TXH2_TOXCA|nr:unnamed protein product [Toxocara canis]
MSATSKCKVLVSGIDRIEVLERIRGARVLVVRYGGHSGTALVNVHVEDVNDNSPIFYPADYNVSVREDAPIGSPLLVLSANDADQGAYGQVRYRIVSGGSDAFRLEPQTGYLYVQNRLTKKSYDVVVQAQDGGGLISERKANVHVSVITPSTPTPQFTSNLYTFMAAEDVLPGISIGQVEATGPFPISYTIYSGDPDHLFTIERTTGKITVSRYLDADKWGSILLNIQVIHCTLLRSICVATVIVHGNLYTVHYNHFDEAINVNNEGR